MKNIKYDDMWYLGGDKIYVDWLRKDTLKECVQRTHAFLSGFLELYPDWKPFYCTSILKQNYFEIPSIEQLGKIIL
jgi:hypothetical protein